jgi:thiamine biosynthesis lipoprotein
MSKTSTEPVRHALNGPTMGTRWSAVFFAGPGFDASPVQVALQQAVDCVDAQMSTWKPDSDLMRLNRAPVGTPVRVPDDLARVLALGLAVGRASGGAFDIGVGDAVQAWGFGPQAADAARIRSALAASRRPAHEALELVDKRVCKRAAVTLDLNGIAKGYGVDRLAQTLHRFGIAVGLIGIDGEMRALGLRPDGEAWTIAVEAPDPDRRAPHSVLALHDGAVATSGDYRHRVSVQGRDLSHTMDPLRAAPLLSPPASVTVLAPTCAEADAWATALMVTGPEAGMALAARQGLSALFLIRGDSGELRSQGCGCFQGEDGAHRAAPSS